MSKVEIAEAFEAYRDALWDKHKAEPKEDDPEDIFAAGFAAGRAIVEQGERRWYIAREKGTRNAHDRAIYVKESGANYHCANLVSNTRRPWIVWPCVVVDCPTPDP